jgi:hypothetical protein
MIVKRFGCSRKIVEYYEKSVNSVPLTDFGYPDYALWLLGFSCRCMFYSSLFVLLPCYFINRFNSGTFLCLSQIKTTFLSICFRHGHFYVKQFEVCRRRINVSCSYCWLYWILLPFILLFRVNSPRNVVLIWDRHKNVPELNLLIK